MYNITTVSASIDSAWGSLLLSKASVIGTRAHCCKRCWNSLANGNLPKFSIANGNYRGFSKHINELKDLTEAEWHLLSLGTTHMTHKHYFAFTSNKKDGHSSSTIHRKGLVGHTTVRKSSLKSLVAVATESNPVIQPGLTVHLCVGSLSTPEEVQAALKKCRHQVTIDTARFLRAYAWLKQHNPRYLEQADVAVVRSNLQSSSTHGIIHNTLVITEAHVSSISPDIAANSSLVGQMHATNSRRSLLVTCQEAEPAANPLLVYNRQVATTAAGFLSSWTAHSDEMMYPWVFPFGRGGTNEVRSVPMSERLHCALLLRSYDRTASQCSRFSLERYDMLTSSTAIRNTCRNITMSTAVQTALQKVTAKQLKAALEYQTTSLQALRSHKPIPPKSAECTDAALLILRTITQSQGAVPGSLRNAKIHRQKAFSMFRYFGNFNFFTTHSADDLSKPAVFNMASPHERLIPGVDAEVAATLAATDSGACAIMYNDLVTTLIDTLYGYDVSKNKAHPGGGIFGSVSAFFGMTEEQNRQSLHLHLLTFIDTLPHTVEDLVAFVQSPQNVKSFLKYVDSTVHTQHPIANHEMLSFDNADHTCENSYGTSEHPPSLKLYDIPERFVTMRTPGKSYMPPPKNVVCDGCDMEFSSLTLTKAWALHNCGAEARTAWDNGNYELHGIDINADLVFELPPPPEYVDPTPDSQYIIPELTIDEFNAVFSSTKDHTHPLTPALDSSCHAIANISLTHNLPQTENERIFLRAQESIVERAKLCLVTLNVNEHSHTHVASCFKYTSRAKNQPSRCRHNKPVPINLETTVLVNDMQLCVCDNICTDASHIR
jgi:hypothetical protein